MRVHVLQHVPFEGLGSIATWLGARKAVVSHTRFFESASLPDPTTVDLVIALGGPMSVNDERELPWLVAEKAFVRSCIEGNKPVLGICLGAQLISRRCRPRVTCIRAGLPVDPDVAGRRRARSAHRGARRATAWTGRQ
jgi:GMP synthase-like glutamine amidotransferase